MKKIEPYSASDYAGLEMGNLAFYYGYEQLYPALGPDEEETDEHEWAFVVFYKGKEQRRIGFSQILKRVSDSYGNSLDMYECEKVLIAGIGVYLQDKLVKGERYGRQH